MKNIIVMAILTISGKCLYSQVMLTGTAHHSPSQKVWLTNFFGKKYDSSVINPKTPTFKLKADIQRESLLIVRFEKTKTYRFNYFIVLPGEQLTFSFNAANNDEYQYFKVSGSPFTIERINEFKKEKRYEKDIQKINKKIFILDVKKGNDTIKIPWLTEKISRDEKQIFVMQKKFLATTKSPMNAFYAYTKIKKACKMTGREEILCWRL